MWLAMLEIVVTCFFRELWLVALLMIVAVRVVWL